MAWAYRTGSYANDGAGWSGLVSGGTQTVTFGAAVSSGDLLVLAVGAATSLNVANPTFTVTDSVNGAWSSTADQTGTWTDSGNGARFSVFRFPNSAAGTPVITVTISSTGGNTFGGLQCAAFSGIATATPKDVSAFGTGTAGTITSGATAATAAANELVVGAYFDLGYNTTLTQGGTFTQAGKHDADGVNWQGMLEYEDSGGSGSTPAATFTSSGSSTWGSIAVVYKLSGGAAPSPIEPPMRTLRGIGI